MINWILIGIICLAAFFVFRLVGLRHGRHKFILTVVLLIILIFVSTFYFVTYKNNVDITNLNGFGTGIKIYGVWLVNAFGNIKALTGNAVRMDWADVNVSVNNTAAQNLGANSSNVAVGNAPVVNNAVDSPPMPSTTPASKPMVKPIIFNSS